MTTASGQAAGGSQLAVARLDFKSKTAIALSLPKDPVAAATMGEGGDQRVAAKAAARQARAEIVATLR